MYAHKNSSFGIICKYPHIRKKIKRLLNASKLFEKFKDVNILNEMKLFHDKLEISYKDKKWLNNPINYTYINSKDLVEVSNEDLLLFDVINNLFSLEEYNKHSEIINAPIKFNINDNKVTRTLYDLLIDHDDEKEIDEKILTKLKGTEITLKNLCLMIKKVFFISWRPKYENKIWVIQTDNLLNSIYVTSDHDIIDILTRSLSKYNYKINLNNDNSVNNDNLFEENSFYLLNISEMLHIFNITFQMIQKIINGNGNEWI
jgi:hypothetical protein